MQRCSRAALSARRARRRAVSGTKSIVFSPRAGAAGASASTSAPSVSRGRRERAGITRRLALPAHEGDHPRAAVIAAAPAFLLGGGGLGRLVGGRGAAGEQERGAQ